MFQRNKYDTDDSFISEGYLTKVPGSMVIDKSSDKSFREFLWIGFVLKKPKTLVFTPGFTNGSLKPRKIEVCINKN